MKMLVFKPSIRWISLTLCACLFFCLIGLEAGESEIKTGRVMIVPGEMFKAAMVAYQDFIDRIRKENDDSSFGKYASKIENYDVEIKRVKAHWVIEFFLKGDDMRGGPAQYRVSNDTYKIVGKTFFK